MTCHARRLRPGKRRYPPHDPARLHPPEGNLTSTLRYRWFIRYPDGTGYPSAIDLPYRRTARTYLGGRGRRYTLAIEPCPTLSAAHLNRTRPLPPDHILSGDR